MFCVYGVSIKECRKQAAKKVHALLIGGKVEQSDYEVEVKKLTDELFKTAKPKSISGELDGSGAPMLTKKTKKPILQWVVMSEHEL